MTVLAFGRRRSAAGFSMIEVLIALVVLAVGLLGLALLQTMNVRFTQSANYRSVATNLAYEMLDMIRTNRLEIAQYAMIDESFAGVVVPANGCGREVAVEPEENIERWQCQVVEALPGGTAEVTIPGDGTVTVAITWNDARWVEAEDRGVGDEPTFTLRTQL